MREKIEHDIHTKALTNPDVVHLELLRTEIKNQQSHLVNLNEKVIEKVLDLDQKVAKIEKLNP